METEKTLPIEQPKTKKTGNVPLKDINLGTLANSVATKWKATPAITLIWMPQTTFSTKAAAFNQELSTRLETGSSRPQITKKLNDLDAKIDSALPYIKGYLLELFKDADTSYYPSFGIEYKKNRYGFPKDRNEKLAALQLMVKAIAANKLGAKEFGTAFWTGIETEYKTLAGKATTTDGTVSDLVGNKNELKKELTKVLNSLIKVIQGNYPDTYKAELRDWGFQKEKY